MVIHMNDGLIHIDNPPFDDESLASRKLEMVCSSGFAINTGYLHHVKCHSITTAVVTIIHLLRCW